LCNTAIKNYLIPCFREICLTGLTLGTDRRKIGCLQGKPNEGQI
jgi:hypothetical protein